MKVGSQNFLLILFILAFSSSLSYASDPGPLQDFCVAIEDPSVLVNGFICKDPNEVTANDFKYSGLDIPGDTSNIFGTKVTQVFAAQVPGLNTLGVGMARVDFAPKGLNPPHTHPRATEIFHVVEGTLYAGFVTSNPNHTLFTTTLRKGDAFVFPQGLIHFQLNIGHGNATGFVSFGSQNPGIITIANTVFGSNPTIFDVVLAKAFQLDKKIVDDLLAKSWPSNT